MRRKSESESRENMVKREENDKEKGIIKGQKRRAGRKGKT
jgi:hypothetical protein